MGQIRLGKGLDWVGSLDKGKNVRGKNLECLGKERECMVNNRAEDSILQV